MGLEDLIEKNNGLTLNFNHSEKDSDGNSIFNINITVTFKKETVDKKEKLSIKFNDDNDGDDLVAFKETLKSVGLKLCSDWKSSKNSESITLPLNDPLVSRSFEFDHNKLIIKHGNTKVDIEIDAINNTFKITSQDQDISSALKNIGFPSSGTINIIIRRPKGIVYCGGC